MILQTKLYPPPRQDALVPRDHLHHILQTGLTRKLTLVSAPAGFGKTTLVSAWLHEQALPLAWLSLDEGDNDPTRFWRYVIAALQTQVPQLGAEVQELFEVPQAPPLEAVVATLINALVREVGEAGPVVLVLDDYHEIDDGAIHRSVNYLLDHQPGSLHVMVLTRSDPPFRLARRLGRREVVEVRASELRLSASEAASFLNDVMALELSDADVEALTGRTEGWIASLQLAAISLRTHPDRSAFIAAFAGDDRYVVDYLIDEVFAQQPEVVQTFLLKTSILDKLFGPLCDAVFQDEEAEASSSGQAMLIELERKNLFLVPLDNRRQWYRYHQLFADVLQRRLHRTLSDRVAGLYRRASQWFERQGEIEDAIRYAIRGEDWERAAELLDAVVKTMWGRRQQVTISRFLDAFPEAVLREAPNLCFWYAWGLLLTGRSEEAADPLTWAEQTWQAQGNQAMLGRVAAARAVEARVRGDKRSLINYARKALKLLPDEMTFARGHSTLLLALGLIYIGKVDEAWPILQKARTTLQETDNIFLRSIADSRTATSCLQRGRMHEALRVFYSLEEEATWRHQLSTSYFVSRGFVLYELNRLDDAEQYLEQARASMENTMENTGRQVFWSHCYVMLARVAWARGDFHQAFDYLDHALALAGRSGDPEKIFGVQAVQVQFWLMQGHHAKAAGVLGGHDFAEEGPIPFEEVEAYRAQARIWIAEGKEEDAIRQVNRLQEAAEADGRLYHAVQLIVLKALALHSAGKHEDAFEAMQQALMRGRSYVRVFLDEGPPMVQLLRAAALHGITSDRIPALLEVFEHEPILQKMELQSSVPSSGTPDLFVEVLSEREVDVLRLIAEGLSNREIAEHLFVSLNTVKTHAKNINAKLNVHNRREAVSRAHLLNLL